MNWKITTETPSLRVYSVATNDFNAQIEHNPKSLYTKLTIGYNLKTYSKNILPPIIHANTAVTCDPTGFAEDQIYWFFHHLKDHIKTTEQELFAKNTNNYEDSTND